MEKMHSIPVPERFLPLIYRTLADAYAADPAESGSGGNTPLIASADGSGGAWAEEEVALVYREGSPALRAVLGHLAENPKREVTSLELARAAYPEDGNDEAEGRLYGVLGAMGRKLHKDYGEREWFFDASRERNPDGSPGGMVYVMSEETAGWVRKAGGRG
ncbi:MAG: hypothetical protein M3R38_10855 [Actinomycetota bacterium]|nr:hypothetical protein [Actinomycetota bacterium]